MIEKILLILAIVFFVLTVLIGITAGILGYNLYKKSVSLEIQKQTFQNEIAKLKALRQIEIMINDGIQKKEETLLKIRNEYEKIDSDNLDNYIDSIIQLQNNGNKNGTDKSKTGNTNTSNK